MKNSCEASNLVWVEASHLGDTIHMCILVARCCDASTTQTHHLLSDDRWEMLGLPESSCSFYDLVLIAEQVVTHIIVRCVSTALEVSGLFKSSHEY